MSGYYDDSDDDYGQEQGPKALRDQLKKLEAKLAEATKALETERTEKAELSKQVKSTTLRNALSDAGIDPKYARFAERDEVEADVEAVKRWADENKDVYAFLNAKPAAPQEPVDGDDEGDEPEDEVDSELLEQLLAGQSLEQAGRPSGSRTITDVLEAVDPSKFKSEAEVDAFLRSLGAPTVNG